jgi:hypothetical protein
MSGVVENATTSAGSPVSTARLCVPDGPNDSENVTPFPAVVCSYAWVSASYAFFGVEYATSASCGPSPLELVLDDAAAAAELVVSDDPPHPARAQAPATAAASAIALGRPDKIAFLMCSSAKPGVSRLLAGGDGSRKASILIGIRLLV